MGLGLGLWLGSGVGVGVRLEVAEVEAHDIPRHEVLRRYADLVALADDLVRREW